MITERLLELGDRVPPILVLPVYSLLPSELQANSYDTAGRYVYVTQDRLARPFP